MISLISLFLFISFYLLANNPPPSHVANVIELTVALTHACVDAGTHARKHARITKQHRCDLMCLTRSYEHTQPHMHSHTHTHTHALPPPPPHTHTHTHAHTHVYTHQMHTITQPHTHPNNHLHMAYYLNAPKYPIHPITSFHTTTHLNIK